MRKERDARAYRSAMRAPKFAGFLPALFLPALFLPAVFLLAGLTGCGHDPIPAEIAEDPPPMILPRGETVAPNTVDPNSVAPDSVDPNTAETIREAIDEIQNMPPEEASEEVRAAAQDASALHGRWQIRHTIHRTNGEASEPSPPLIPTAWIFDSDGSMQIRGANRMDLRYTYTGDRLVITGMGPAQDYRVDSVSEAELRVTAVIEAGSLRLENTTVLERADS